MNLRRALIKEICIQRTGNLDVNGSRRQTRKNTAVALDMRTPLLNVQGAKIIHTYRGEWWIFGYQPFFW